MAGRRERGSAATAELAELMEEAALDLVRSIEELIARPTPDTIRDARMYCGEVVELATPLRVQTADADDALRVIAQLGATARVTPHVLRTVRAASVGHSHRRLPPEFACPTP